MDALDKVMVCVRVPFPTRAIGYMLSIEAEKANQIDQSKVALTFARAKVRKVPMFV